jgi:phage-related protein
MLPQLVETGITLIMSILEGLTLAIPLITQAIVDMIPRLVDALVTGIPLLIDGAVQLLLALLDAIPLILPPLVEAIPQIVIAIIDGLLTALPDLIEGAVQFLLAIVQAIPILLDALLPEVPRIVDTIIDGLLDNLPVLIDGAIELLFGILEALPEIQAAIWEEMPSIVTSIVDALLEAIPELIKAGGQLLEGLVEGMLDFDIKGALKKVGDGVINGFKKAFDIHSPSRVMMGIGELLDEGLAEGIIDNAGEPINALDKLSEDMLHGVEGLNGVTVERRMAHTNTPGASSVAEGISDKLDRIYQAILEGQVIMLDSKVLVGSTANRYDTELGQRRVLAERGAL